MSPWDPLKIFGRYVWAAGEGSGGMGGPLNSGPPCTGGRSRDRQQVRRTCRPGAPLGPFAGKGPPGSRSHSTNII